ncbi:Thiolase, domain-containing protein isoform 2 [Cladophialophora immunda]|nr:Thiolase, domain-containing protein isoform 2 [Cladophialophora immunda]
MMASGNPVYILGVGMTKFVKPQPKNDYADMGFEAGVKALLDAHITYDDVQMGVASYCYGDSTCGQRVLYQFGMTQIPIYNVNNNCASGSTAMVMARDFVRYGAADCVLAVGFEKMATGSLGSNFSDRTDPLDRAKVMSDHLGNSTPKAPFAAKMFGNAAEEYIKKFGAAPEDFAEIARINHEHSQRNPYAQFQTNYTKDQVLKSPAIYGVLTKLQCCPTSDGSAAAVVVSQAFLDARPHLKSQAVQILGQCLATDSWANNRLVSVPAGKLALQQNAGLGGACVVTILRRADGQVNAKLSDAEIGRVNGLRYNPAVEARGFTMEQAESVRSSKRSDWAAEKRKGFSGASI